MADAEKIKRLRSPNFPGLTLEKCIEFTKLLYDRYRRSPVAQEVAIKGLGYSPTSGGSLQLAAALSAYNLIESVGSGPSKKIRLSDLAFNIIEDKRQDSPDRDAAIIKAALAPPIFRKIKEDNPYSLPAEDALAHDLKFTYHFNPNSVRSFLNVLTNTFSYAKVYEADIIPEDNLGSQEREPIKGSNMQTQMSSKSSISGSFITLPANKNESEIANYPVGRGVTIKLLASGPVTQESIKKLIKILEINVEDFESYVDLAKTNDHDFEKQ